MGLGPLAQPLFYQHRCTHWQADRLCCNGSGEITAIHDRFASITIKRGNLIALDLLQSPAAQPREALDRPPTLQPIAPGLGQRRHRSRGQAALPSIPCQKGGGGRRRLSDVSHGAAVASSGRPPPAGANSSRLLPQFKPPRISGLRRENTRCAYPLKTARIEGQILK